jgi:hypothetical protein
VAWRDSQGANLIIATAPAAVALKLLAQPTHQRRDSDLESRFADHLHPMKNTQRIRIKTVGAARVRPLSNSNVAFKNYAIQAGKF